MNKIDKAEFWHNKLIQMLKDLKDKKQKHMFSNTIQHNIAEIAYRKEEFDNKRCGI